MVVTSLPTGNISRNDLISLRLSTLFSRKFIICIICNHGSMLMNIDSIIIVTRILMENFCNDL